MANSTMFGYTWLCFLGCAICCVRCIGELRRAVRLRMIKTGIWGSTLGLLQCKAQWGHHNKAEYQPPSLWGTRGIPNPITTLGASLALLGLCHANQSRQQHCQWHHQQWGGTPQSHWCPLTWSRARLGSFF